MKTLIRSKQPDETKEDYLINLLQTNVEELTAPYNRWVDLVDEVLWEEHKQDILELNHGDEYISLETELLCLRKDKYDEMVSEFFHPDEIKDGKVDEEDINQELEMKIRDIEQTIEDRVFDLIEEEAEKREQEEEMED